MFISCDDILNISHAIVDQTGFTCWAILTRENGAVDLSYNATIIGGAGKCKNLEKMLQPQPVKMTKPASSSVCVIFLCSPITLHYHCLRSWIIMRLGHLPCELSVLSVVFLSLPSIDLLHTDRFCCLIFFVSR